MLACSIAFAEIRQVSQLFYVQQELEKSDKDTLVIFDVDLTLIEPRDQIFSHSSLDEFAKVNDLLKSRHTEDEIEGLLSIVWATAPAQTVESDTLAIFKSIQDRYPNVMFLTAMNSGRYGKISKQEDWRIEELTRLGFNLNSTLPKASTEQLKPYLSAIKAEHSPLCKKGILFSSFLDKGDVLKAYLRHIGFKPRKIVFVDDLRKNVESLAKYCDENNIVYVGFEYTAWKHRIATPQSNPKRALLQFEVLDSVNTWLSDKEADRILDSLGNA